MNFRSPTGTGAAADLNFRMNHLPARYSGQILVVLDMPNPYTYQ